MDYLFDGFQAFASLQMLIIGVPVFLIGLVVLLYQFYERLNSVKVKARIKYIAFSPSKSSQAKDIETPKNTKEKGKGKKSAAFFFLCFGMIFSLFGAWQVYKYYSLKASGIYVQARVVDNERSVDSEGSVTYHAIVSFRDRDGKMQRARDNIGFGRASYQIGVPVGVYYDAKKPKRFIIDDFWHNMTAALIFLAIGPFLFFVVSFFENLSVSAPKAQYGNYKPVYEYYDHEGNVQEYPASWSSSMMGAKLPGDSVTLLGRKTPPYRVKGTGLVLYIVGFIFLFAGSFVLYEGLKNFEMNLMMVLFLIAGICAVIIWIAMKVNALPKKARGEIAEAFQTFKEDGFKGNFEVTEAGSKLDKSYKALSNEDLRIHSAQASKSYAISSLVIVVFAFGCLVAGYFIMQDTREFLMNAVSTQGQVVGMTSKRSSDSVSYYAQIEYEDFTGTKQRFQDSVGSSHTSMHKGDVVNVLYNPEKSGDAIVDRGFLNWGLAWGFVIGAILFALMAYSNNKNANRLRRRMSLG